MKKITKPYKPYEENYIFTEGVNYFTTGKSSIWGKGDKATLDFLEKINLHGKWLNLAAGDGRYNIELLKKVDFLVASDIDAGALSKLWHNTPEKYKHKLGIKVFNIIKKFPFRKNSFDGVFCAGFLHLFPEKILEKIFLEIDRILKPKGKVIIDFATDVKRISLTDGKFLKFGNEPLYTLEEGRKVLKNIFQNYKTKIYESRVPEELFKSDPPYKFSCNFILLLAEKK